MGPQDAPWSEAMKEEKIRRGLIALLLGAALALPAAANLRAPRKVDGTFSGHLKAGPPASRLRLVGERLEASLPRMSLSDTDPKSPVWLRIVYEIENPGSAPARIPLRFLAVDIRDLRVEIDGREVKAAVRAAPEEKAECLTAMARHRRKFLPDFYKGFLDRLGLLASEGGETPWFKAFSRTLEEWEEGDPAAADFEAVLPPGRSRLVVSYAQRLFIDERGHGYFAVWPKKGVTGFDYLLYPAKSWTAAPDFKLEVAVEVPEAAGKKLFFNVYRKPAVRCNLPLREVPGCAFGNGSTYKGEFKGGMPADILTFLLWFDEAAPAYLR
jgi:hypothetical protein